MKPARDPASSRPKPCASLKKPRESCPFAAPCGRRRKKNDRGQRSAFPSETSRFALSILAHRGSAFPWLVNDRAALRLRRIWCVCVCVYCVCRVFIKLHITAQSGPVILVIICHSRLCVCVCIYLIAHNRAIRPCHPSHSMPLALMLILPRGGGGGCFLPIHSGHQIRWTYQPGSHRRKVITRNFSSTFLNFYFFPERAPRGGGGGGGALPDFFFFFFFPVQQTTSGIGHRVK